MQNKTFIPFYDIKKYPHEVLVVDAHHPQGFDLSHWRGAPAPKGCQADTSTEIVLKAIQNQLPELNKKYVTNNHYDIDGFLGVWAIFNPSIAMENYDLLTEMAQIGDFREINFQYLEWKKALKIVCWLNEKEATLFYPPFGAPEIAEKEMEACVPKYIHFLDAFNKVIDLPLEVIPETEEFNLVLTHLAKIDQQETIDDIRMHIVDAKEPLHYYALYNNSQLADMVMSIYPDNRYELEFKYTTWINTNRKHFPRISMEKLCDQLNHIEENGKKWEAEHFTDTAPILRLKGKKLSKKERYLSPCFRPIYSSSIRPEDFKSICFSYFNDHYNFLKKGETLDWKQVRKINDKIFT
ncbi:DUF6687 family protein [Marivirga harenae]|uniref:DUF6687 family protein n=1 Tax=Marivirga harenae TaxID=2010992 RepID=UPI0026E0F7A4|nr:DUF6687 family protein [Marivirga harenae]WKV10451.1 hypothetical protein Q3Y49_09510 [Marivirga harenae]|tara:strand:- start:377859 stop:378914 length:1056 start_codon:yes stop_codon:yes gene_type:complete